MLYFLQYNLEMDKLLQKLRHFNFYLRYTKCMTVRLYWNNKREREVTKGRINNLFLFIYFHEKSDPPKKLNCCLIKENSYWIYKDDIKYLKKIRNYFKITEKGIITRDGNIKIWLFHRDISATKYLSWIFYH